MTTPSHRQSAVIYDFASKARAVTASRGRANRLTAHPVPSLPTVDFGSGWYHEEAIREEERTRKP